MTTEAKPNALAALKALGQKKPVASTSPIAMQINDPAIAGAKLNKTKTGVVLGFDPTITERAAYAASLKQALEDATAAFTIAQGEMRDYGKSKRDLFNDTFKADVTTVSVPFNVETPTGPEQKVVQVICSNKYSVQKDTILNNRAEFGEHFERLFKVDETKSLKPNAEDLIRGVFSSVGLSGEELENAMGELFETKTAVATTENYEQEARKVPEPLKAILDVSVTRAQPGLKFP